MSADNMNFRLVRQESSSISRANRPLEDQLILMGVATALDTEHLSNFRAHLAEKFPEERNKILGDPYFAERLSKPNYLPAAALNAAKKYFEDVHADLYNKFSCMNPTQSLTTRLIIPSDRDQMDRYL